ncbi:MFS transporter [Sphingomonas rubra]|uniref:MFS transporter n=1 Tax=Sphingomonas rubra TaxID=634430 RepID=UPI001FE0EA7A|nr:MFS transporter [Sphingomonas rubra]
MPHSSEFSRNGRLLLACVAGIAFGSVGIAVYSIGAFVDPLGRAFGWSRTDVQTALLFSSGLGGLAAPVVGHLVERFGARPMAMIGLVGVALGFVLAASNGGQLWLFYLAYTVIAILGGGSGPISWTYAIAGRFDKHRGAALAIALSGTGLVAIIAPPYIVWLTQEFGWRVGFLGVAALPLFVALPLAFLYFRPPDRTTLSEASGGAPTPPGLTTRQAIASYRFWVLLLSILAMYLGIAGIIPNLIPALADKGIPARSAAFATSAFGVSVIVGRLLVGSLVDRFWAPGVAAVILTPAAAGCLLLTGQPTIGVAIGAAVLIGLAAGAELDLLAFLTARYFGLRGYAKTYGLLYAGVALAGGTGPMAFAYIHQVAGSFDVSFAISAALFLLGGPAALTLGRYPRER